MIHVQTWAFQRSAKITDMTNAGKRGKVCRVLHVHGENGGQETGPEAWKRAHNEAVNAAGALAVLCAGFAPETSYDDAEAALRACLAQYPGAGGIVTIEADTCRGVDAPRVKLVAGVPNVWAGSADEGGISLRDLKDQFNEPCMITPNSQQSPARAYELAAKVWELVKAAKSFSQAGDILQTAGCRLHYFCAVD